MFMLHRRKYAVIALMIFKLLLEAGQPSDLSTNTLDVLGKIHSILPSYLNTAILSWL